MARKKITEKQFNEIHQGNIWVKEKGKSIWVKPLEECFSMIEKRVKFFQDRNEELAAENKRLKDEHFKDNELARLEEKLEEAEDDLTRGFPVTKEEHEKLKKWQEEHDKKRHSKKRKRKEDKIYEKSFYTYRFFWSKYGVIGFCECEKCKAEAMNKSDMDQAEYDKLCNKYDAIYQFKGVDWRELF